MKRLSIALAATALVALAGCGSRTANNAAAVDTSNDVYNVSPDDLTLNDLGNASGNGSTSGNASSSGNASAGNSSSAGNASSGSSSHAARNSH